MGVPTSRVDTQRVTRGDIGSIYGGTVIDRSVNIEEAMALAGINWEVGTKNMCLADKQRTPMPGYFGTYRKTDDPKVNIPLGVVRSRYVPMQNWEAFKVWQPFLSDQACITSAGALHGGRYTWICLNLGEWEVLPGDVVERHLLIINSHDGSSQIIAQILPNRTACQNILNAHTGATGGSDPFKIRHTGTAMLRLEEARMAFDVAQSGFAEVKETFALMAKTQITEDQTWALIYKGLAVPPKKLKEFFSGKHKGKTPQWVGQAAEIFKVIETGAGSDIKGVRGSVWGALQGFTGWYDWGRKVRGSKENPDNAIESKIMRHDARKKVIAYQACRDFCQN